MFFKPRRIGSWVSVSTSNVVGRVFAPRPGHTKVYHKYYTNYLTAWNTCVSVGG